MPDARCCESFPAGAGSSLSDLQFYPTNSPLETTFTETDKIPATRSGAPQTTDHFHQHGK